MGRLQILGTAGCVHISFILTGCGEADCSREAASYCTLTYFVCLYMSVSIALCVMRSGWLLNIVCCTVVSDRDSRDFARFREKFPERIT